MYASIFKSSEAAKKAWATRARNAGQAQAATGKLSHSNKLYGEMSAQEKAKVDSENEARYGKKNPEGPAVTADQFERMRVADEAKERAALAAKAKTNRTKKEEEAMEYAHILKGTCKPKKKEEPAKKDEVIAKGMLGAIGKVVASMAGKTISGKKTIMPIPGARSKKDDEANGDGGEIVEKDSAASKKAWRTRSGGKSSTHAGGFSAPAKSGSMTKSSKHNQLSNDLGLL